MLRPQQVLVQVQVQRPRGRLPWCMHLAPGEAAQAIQP